MHQTLAVQIAEGPFWAHQLFLQIACTFDEFFPDEASRAKYRLDWLPDHKALVAAAKPYRVNFHPLDFS